MGVMSSKKVEAFMSIKTSGWGEEMVGKEIISEVRNLVLNSIFFSIEIVTTASISIIII